MSTKLFYCRSQHETSHCPRERFYLTLIEGSWRIQVMELLYCCNLVGLQLVLSLYIYRYSLYKTFQNFPVRQHRQFYFLFDASEKLPNFWSNASRELAKIRLYQRIGPTGWKEKFHMGTFFCCTPT